MPQSTAVTPQLGHRPWIGSIGGCSLPTGIRSQHRHDVCDDPVFGSFVQIRFKPAFTRRIQFVLRDPHGWKQRRFVSADHV